MAANTSRSWLFALGLAVGGCQSATVDADAGLPAVIEVQDSGPLVALDAPAEVIAFAGSDAPKALFAKLGTRDPSRDAAAKIGERYGLSKNDVVDLDKPMRVAIFDPKAFVLIVGIESRDDLLAALPSERRESDGVFQYEVGKRTVSVSFVGESVVLSEQADLIARHRDFVAKLAGAKPGAGMALSLRLQKKIAELQKLRDWGLDQVVRAELLLDADKRGLHATLTVHPRGGTALSKTLTALQKCSGHKPALLDKLPDKPMFALGASVDPESSVARTLAAWLLQTPAESEALSAFSRATTGELAIALHEHKPGEPVLSALVGLRDAKSARDAARLARQAYAEPRVIEALAKLGARLMFQPNAYMLGATPVDIVTAVDTEPPAGGQALSAHRALGVGANSFFSLLSSNMALDGDLGIVTFGGHARLAMAGWRTRPPSGLSFDFDKKAFAVARLWPARLLKAGDGEAVVLRASAHDGALDLKLDVPRAEASRLDEALTELRKLP
ncbi:MAG TPA: hypothetical protein VFB62_07530 [Polyangiaceae bacterium]|nr:hypothetical protein [Polyangiaceae bacterium]